MQVTLVEFPVTPVAMITHLGNPKREHETAGKLIQWKIQNQLLDQTKYKSYGLHYGDSQTTIPEEHRVDFCLSIDTQVKPNDFGIVEGIITGSKCALARDIGSRLHNQAARYLIEQWLPQSGETMSQLPIIFHYVNVGPAVKESDAITDVYLPLL